MELKTQIEGVKRSRKGGEEIEDLRERVAQGSNIYLAERLQQ